MLFHVPFCSPHADLMQSSWQDITAKDHLMDLMASPGVVGAKTAMLRTVGRADGETVASLIRTVGRADGETVASLIRTVSGTVGEAIASIRTGTSTRRRCVSARAIGPMLRTVMSRMRGVVLRTVMTI